MSEKPKLEVVESIAGHRYEEMARRMVDAVKEMIQDDICAFAIVTIAADGCANCQVNSGGVMPLWAFPATVEKSLTTRSAKAAWKKPGNREHNNEARPT